MRETRNDHALISSGPHWQYGWLRRKELDEGENVAYEQPCGDIVLSADPLHYYVMILECREDEWGDRYICVSHDIQAYLGFARLLNKFSKYVRQ